MPTKYDEDVRARAIRPVRDHAGDYDAEWAAIREIWSRLGSSAEMLLIRNGSGVAPICHALAAHGIKIASRTCCAQLSAGSFPRALWDGPADPAASRAPDPVRRQFTAALQTPIPALRPGHRAQPRIPFYRIKPIWDLATFLQRDGRALKYGSPYLVSRRRSASAMVIVTSGSCRDDDAVCWPRR